MPAPPRLTMTRSPSVVGEALQYQSCVQLRSFSANSTSFFQSWLPLARSKQMRLRTLPPRFAMVRKTRSPQITGVELPGCSSLIFHLTFCLSLHLVGRSFSAQYPCPVGPRQGGQLLAATAVVKTSNP